MNVLEFTVNNPRTATRIAYVAAAHTAMGGGEKFRPWSCPVKIEITLYVKQPRSKSAPLPMDLCEVFNKVRLACCGVVYDKASRVLDIRGEKVPTDGVECLDVTITKLG